MASSLRQCSTNMLRLLLLALCATQHAALVHAPRASLAPRTSTTALSADVAENTEAQRIITCGACKAVYAIDMDMLGSGAGAKVRCEVCGNVWFQSAARVNSLFDGFELKPYDAEKAKQYEESAAGRAPPPRRVAGAATLFVANLPFSFGDADLADLFAGCGDLASATVVRDDDGRSRGFGFVDVVAEADAQPAIDKLNGSEVDGRDIIVRIGNRGGGGPGGGRGGRGGRGEGRGGGRGGRGDFGGRGGGRGRGGDRFD